MLLVDRLLAAQQFDAALKMCHHVLTPYAPGADAKRFWQFLPFKETDAENVLEIERRTVFAPQPANQRQP